MPNRYIFLLLSGVVMDGTFEVASAQSANEHAKQSLK